MLFPFVALIVVAPSTAGTVGEGVPDFEVRRGYHVSVAADIGENTRFLEVSEDGTLFVSQPRPGRILALTDADGDGVYENRTTFVEGHDTAHGMDWHDGELWFTTSGAIHRAKDTDGDGAADDVVTVIDDLPEGGGHWWRSLCVTDDGHLFTSIGDSGNTTVDEYEGSDRQKIWRFNHDGSGKTLWSTGIRNTEKLRLRPGTDELWGADHGSDWFGRSLGEGDGDVGQPVTNRIPPEEFNHYVEGGFYGHPFIVGNGLPRYEFTERDDILELAAKTIVPEYEGGAHWANNGFTFMTGDRFADHPDGTMDGDAIIAYHGSWNRQPPEGYQVHRVLFDEVTGKPIGGFALVECLRGPRRLARPVDAVAAPDGSVLWSCDMTNKVYRISPIEQE